jgi:uncharacterized hydrophobic protein (TIGR00271 family)
VAIAFLIASVSELEQSVPAALKLSGLLDKPLAVLCLEATTDSTEARPQKESKPGTNTGKGREEQGEPKNGDPSAAFVNRVSYLEDARATIEAQQRDHKGMGASNTEVFEIPVALDKIRSWVQRPPATNELGRFQVETLYIPFFRGAGTEESLDLKNRLFNLVSCEAVYVSAKGQLDWKSALDVIACTGRSKKERQAALRFAAKFRPSRAVAVDVENIAGEYPCAIVGVRKSNTHIETSRTWNSLRRHDQVDLVMALNPADSAWNRCQLQIDQWLHSRFAEYQITRDQREKLAKELATGTRPSAEFILFMSLATLLATIGLLENSGAVVIGAMLVAPLMTPLLGAGLAMLQGNLPGFQDALKAIGIGIVISIVIGICVGLFALVLPKQLFAGSELKLTSEMIARSHPNLLDPLIGLAAGLAGGFAIGRDKKIGALAGVAIAAALVPPVATAGLEAAIVMFCAIQDHSFATLWQLVTNDPAEILSSKRLIAADHDVTRNVRLVAAPLALFVMNACAVIMGAFLGLRFVGMHRTMHPKGSRPWVSLALVALVTALMVLLATIPVVAYFAR